MKKWLFTLLAGYAAGLAIAMKYRKDQGTSKLEADTSKTTIDSLINEVVDIHKTAYNDVKEFVSNNFSDVKDFEGLKAKIEAMMEDFTMEVSSVVAAAQEGTAEQKTAAKAEVDAIFDKKSAIIEEAKERGSSLTDATFEVISSWLDEAKGKLEKTRTKIQAKIK